LTLSKILSIQGNALNPVEITRDTSKPSFRIFYVSANESVVLSGLIISEGAASDGGGILNAGSLTLISDDIHANAAIDKDGGGVENSFTGDVELQGTHIQTNTAKRFGGGFANWNSATIDYGSQIYNNSALGGGGIYNSASAALDIFDDSQIYANSASTGGGIYSSGTLGMHTGLIQGNSVTLMGGGVYINGGTAELWDVDLLSNSANKGGGFYVDVGALTAGNLTLGRCTISGNTATTVGMDAGVWKAPATYTLSDCTLSGQISPDT
jgi:hypothetical protein